MRRRDNGSSGPADPTPVDSTSVVPGGTGSDEQPGHAGGGVGALLGRLRSIGLPDEVLGEFAAMFEAIAGDVRREVRGLRLRDLRNPRAVARAVAGMSEGLEDAQRQMVDIAVRHPLPIAGQRAQLASAAAISGGATAAEQAVTYGSAGSALALTVVGAVVAELLDTYVIASARVLQIRASGHLPTQAMIERDLHAALGGTTRKHRHSSDGDQSARIVSWMSARLARRVTTRVMKGIALAVGVGWASASTMRDLKKVQDLPVDDAFIIDLPADAAREVRP